MLIGCHGNTICASAYQDSDCIFSIFNCTGNRMSKVWVVNRVSTIGSKVFDCIIFQKIDEHTFIFKTCMISSYSDRYFRIHILFFVSHLTRKRRLNFISFCKIQSPLSSYSLPLELKHKYLLHKARIKGNLRLASLPNQA